MLYNWAWVTLSQIRVYIFLNDPAPTRCLVIYLGLLIINFLFLNFAGTLSSGIFCLFVGKPRFSINDSILSRIGSFMVNLLVASSQLFTVLFCLVGWGWSVWWGVMMVKMASKLIIEYYNTLGFLAKKIFYLWPNKINNKMFGRWNIFTHQGWNSWNLLVQWGYRPQMLEGLLFIFSFLLLQYRWPTKYLLWVKFWKKWYDGSLDLSGADNFIQTFFQ